MLLLPFSTEASSCFQDGKKFCPGVDQGKGQLARCLDDFKDQLSADCAKELKEFKKKTLAKNPCFEDLIDLCSDVPAKGNRAEYCLLKNESRLSPTCSADFKQQKGKILVKNVCAQDIVNLCYNQVKSSDRAINHCLVHNREKLSSFCQKKVDVSIEKMKKGNPCFESTLKFCPDKIKRVDIQDCLEKKVSALPETCKKIVLNEKRKAQENPCYRDLVKHCVPNLSPQEQHQCLVINESVLSSSCRQFRVNEGEKIKKMAKLCEPDRIKFCKDETPKNGRILKCLRKNREKLFKECAELM